MIVSRCAAGFLILCLLTQPAYALPTISPAFDPTKRLYTYDLASRLTGETRTGSQPYTIAYAYDKAGNRIEKRRLSPAGTVPVEIARYVYDGEGKRITVTEAGVTAAFLYDGLLPILERQGTTTTATNTWGLSFGGGIGGLLSRHDPGASDPNQRFLYPLYDGSGNVLAWADETGSLISATSYTAFGEVVSQTGSVQPYSYSTKAYSSATGLSYFGARYYRPDLARWLTQDPLGMVNGPNLYLFAGNNPVSFIDPWGYDYWIEGPSAGEPNGHQSVNVGDPNGDYSSYSFGVNGNINRKHGLEGEIYRDPMKGGGIEPGFYRETTPQEDAVIRAYLESQVGTKGPYTPWSTCRNWSQNQFVKLVRAGHGGPSTRPSRPNQTGQPSSEVPFISSTVTSSEPFGFPSGTTNRSKVKK